MARLKMSLSLAACKTLVGKPRTKSNSGGARGSRRGRGTRGVISLSLISQKKAAGTMITVPGSELKYYY